MLLPKEDTELISEALFRKKESPSKKAAAKIRADLTKEIDRLRKKKKEDLRVSDVSRLAHLVYRIPPDNVTDDVVSVFQVLRFVLFVGLPFLVHPALALVGWLVNKVIEEKVNEKYEGTVMNRYRDELKHVEDRLKDPNLSEDQKTSLSNTKRTLEESISKLERHFRTMRAYKDPHEDTSSSSSSSDDFSFDFSEDSNYLESKGGTPMIAHDDQIQERMILQLNESIDELIDIILENDMTLSESKLRNATRKVAGKIERANRKSSAKIDGVADTIIDGGRQNEKKRMRQEIMDGRLKVSTVVKRAVALGTITAINPAIGVLTATVFLFRKGLIKKNQQTQLLAELKSELEIVEEKIKDAESENDKKKKYQYIRLRREIQRSIDKIRYHDTLRDRY